MARPLRLESEDGVDPILNWGNDRADICRTEKGQGSVSVEDVATQTGGVGSGRQIGRLEAGDCVATAVSRFSASAFSFLVQNQPRFTNSALRSKRRDAFIFSKPEVARPIALNPTTRIPTMAKCSCQASRRGWNSGTTVFVSGSIAERFGPLWKLQRWQAQARFSALVAPPC